MRVRRADGSTISAIPLPGAGCSMCVKRIRGSMTERNLFSGPAGLHFLSGLRCIIGWAAWKAFFFAHQEEIDLCWRIQLAGYKVYCCPESVVYHVGGGTLPKGNERKVFLNFRNNLIMMAKCLPLGQSVWKMPLRLLLDSISAWKSLFAGEAVYFWAILEAHLAFFKWLMVSRKKSLFPPKRKAPLTGWYRGSIVWQYFVKGKKTFNEIVKRNS